MNKQEIEQAISGIAQLLANNPELMQQQLTAFKALVPDLDETAIQSILEKAKKPRFNACQLEEEVEQVVSAINSAQKK